MLRPRAGFRVEQHNATNDISSVPLRFTYTPSLGSWPGPEQSSCPYQQHRRLKGGVMTGA